MSDAYPLATEPEGIAAALLERFNTGEVSAMMGFYEPGAVFITEAGNTLTEQDQIAEELGRFLGLGLPMVATARHLFVADDIVQIVLDWSIAGIGPDGAPVHLAGVASDIARRGADGYWRYLIDNPFGTQVRTGG
ncbi:YybH family protein [Saccharopolyspora sp. 5N708]|uniref:YybH family protein n=1 Tax=Saccharopolyspora sp. 5N708 TaxID=3457424 RepID=UPI003FD26822